MRQPASPMKLMICMGGEDFSRGTIFYGGGVAKALQADISVLYVESSVPYFFRHHVQVSRQKLSEWSIELPAMRILRLARGVLREIGLMRVLPTGEIEVRHEMKPDIQGAYEWHVYGARGENIRFRIRQGDIVDNIKQEVDAGGYDLVVLGASKKRRLVHKIFQFIDTSILIVKNPKDVAYRFLLCTDGSEAARKAELFVGKAAKLVGSTITILSIYRGATQQHHAMEAAERCARFLTRCHVRHDTIVREGDVEKVILGEAQSDHIVALGVSKQSELRQFFIGSTPIRISQRGHFPVLLVK